MFYRNVVVMGHSSYSLPIDKNGRNYGSDGWGYLWFGRYCSLVFY